MTINAADNIVQVGAKLGRRAGLMLSLIYAILGFMVLELLGQGTGLFSVKFYDGFPWGDYVAAILAIICLIVILAIAPAILIGDLTGRFLGVLAKSTSAYIPRYLFVVLCLVSCLVVVILLHLLFQIPITLSFYVSSPDGYSLGSYESYPFYIGIPSVIYVLASGWLGWKIYPKASNVAELE